MPKIVDKEQRRREVIIALWAVIGQRGIEGVTFGEVARAAGVSVGRIQHYFSSKEELVLAGVEAIASTATEHHEERVASTRDPEEALVALLAQPLPRSQARRLGTSVWYAYVTRGIVDPAVGEVIARASRGTQEEARRLLTAAHADPDRAPSLVALSVGLTQAVLLGVLPVERAEALVMEAVRAAMVAID